MHRPGHKLSGSIHFLRTGLNPQTWGVSVVPNILNIMCAFVFGTTPLLIFA